MQISDVSGSRGYSEHPAEGVTLTQLYPHGSGGNGLLALDLIEIEAGGRLPEQTGMEERVLFVVSGTGELSQDGGPAVAVRAGSVVALSALDGYSLRNTDNVRMRVLVSSSLVARTARSMGVKTAMHASRAAEREPEEVAGRVRERPSAVAQPQPSQEPQEDGRDIATEAAPEESSVQTQAPEEIGEAQEEQEAQEPTLPVDISGLMKRGSDVAATPRSEQRKPPPAPEAEIVEEPPQEADEEAEESEQSNLMELQLVFDGGSRGNPGQGYGSYLVQAPGRKAIIKRVEFGDNYTNNQAEYDSLIKALEYVIDRLEATGRSPEQVQLDIKGDSDLVVNQILGQNKVKDAGLRKRHAQATDLLGRFADWTIAWHPRDESVKLLGH